jgi:TatA/E family protein of Tat protein translocase
VFGSSEILIVAIVVLVLFGATALPKFFRSLGKAKSEFQKGASEAEHSGAGPESTNRGDAAARRPPDSGGNRSGGTPGSGGSGHGPGG